MQPVCARHNRTNRQTRWRHQQLRARAQTHTPYPTPHDVPSPPPTHTLTTDALARNFASQCGFCTPGITLSMAAAAAAGDQGVSAGAGARAGADHPAAVALAQGLDGSLCRCTGWRPIIDTCRVSRGSSRMCVCCYCHSPMHQRRWCCNSNKRVVRLREPRPITQGS